MSAPLSEIVRWKYHARKLQVDRIVELADASINAEVDANANQFRRLDAILMTPPTFLRLVIDDFQESEGQFYTESSAALRIVSKRVRTLEVLMRLAKACSEETPGTKEVAIDFVDSTTPLHIKLAFRDRKQMLEQMVSEGREEATKKILDLTQGKIPLMRYRRDLAVIKFPLSPTIDGGLSGYIPTRIDNVYLRFWYLKEEILPHLSFKVISFEEGK